MTDNVIPFPGRKPRPPKLRVVEDEDRARMIRELSDDPHRLRDLLLKSIEMNGDPEPPEAA